MKVFRSRFWAPAIMGAVLASTLAWYALTRLALSPVPWPDGSAFYLPSIELLKWPPAWQMHSQSAFVPSYDQANFNMMPLLPFILGGLSHLGFKAVFGAPLAIKVISLLALIACAGSLWMGFKRASGSAWVGAVLSLAILWDPVDRWGTLVVRSEVWIGLIWIWILWELSRLDRLGPRKEWRISGLLAAAALIHFEAIILVLPTALALGLGQESSHSRLRTRFFWDGVRPILSVGARTAFLLSPWALYILMHFPLFVEQMQIQFTRLQKTNYWVSNPYLLFHSLFLELGSPVGVPKFFNLAKGLFWLMIPVLTGQVFWEAWKGHRSSSNFKAPSQKNSQPATLGLLLGAAAAFWSSFYLWLTKPEIWFITLCHLTFWPWVGIAFLRAGGFQKRFLAIGTCGYVGLSFFANLGIQFKTHDSYSWSVYSEWVSCIERAVGLASEKMTPRVWQPHVPDVLVELSDRKSRWDLMRTLDFDALKEVAWKSTRTMDAIIMSRHFVLDEWKTSSQIKLPQYEGPERPIDQKWIVDEGDQPFGNWILSRLPLEQPGQWERHVCHIGPFFADVAVRVRAEAK